MQSTTNQKLAKIGSPMLAEMIVHLEYPVTVGVPHEILTGSYRARFDILKERPAGDLAEQYYSLLLSKPEEVEIDEEEQELIDAEEAEAEYWAEEDRLCNYGVAGR